MEQWVISGRVISQWKLCEETRCEGGGERGEPAGSLSALHRVRACSCPLPAPPVGECVSVRGSSAARAAVFCFVRVETPPRRHFPSDPLSLSHRAGERHPHRAALRSGPQTAACPREQPLGAAQRGGAAPSAGSGPGAAALPAAALPLCDFASSPIS